MAPGKAGSPGPNSVQRRHRTKSPPTERAVDSSEPKSVRSTRSSGRSPNPRSPTRSTPAAARGSPCAGSPSKSSPADRRSGHRSPQRSGKAEISGKKASPARETVANVRASSSPARQTVASARASSEKAASPSPKSASSVAKSTAKAELVRSLPQQAKAAAQPSAGQVVVASPLARSAHSASTPEAGGGGSRAAAARHTTIVSTITHGTASQVKAVGLDWANMCTRNPQASLLVILKTILELSGLPDGGPLTVSHLAEDPNIFLDILPDWLSSQGKDVTNSPISSNRSGGTAKKASVNLERFWASGLGAQTTTALLESGLLSDLIRWFVPMSFSLCRPVRHAATIAALSVADVLGYHCHTLRRTQATMQRQADAGIGNAAQVAQIRKDLDFAKVSNDEMQKFRMQVLEKIVPARSRDVCEAIRLLTLGEVERLFKGDPDLYLQEKWTTRIFLMIYDPSVDVRLKAIGIIQSWYSPSSKYPNHVREQLNLFADRCLGHLVERVTDVDSRVAAAALRCLRLPQLADRLYEREFEHLVNMCPSSRDPAVRVEAGNFINSHVFQDPGIVEGPPKKRSKTTEGDAAEDANEGQSEIPSNANLESTMYNTEIALSMLVTYLDEYLGDRLRLCERVISAFWGRAPALTSWTNMMRLCFVPEQNVGQDSEEELKPNQRLALMYIMEASMRRLGEELDGKSVADQKVAMTKLSGACSIILPEMPRLVSLCFSEPPALLLVLQVCKMLLDFAEKKAQLQVTVFAEPLKACLRRSTEVSTNVENINAGVNAMLALVRCYPSAQVSFVGLAKTIFEDACRALEPEVFRQKPGDALAIVCRMCAMSNRGVDMSFGRADLLECIICLLDARIEWSAGIAAAAADAEQGGRDLLDIGAVPAGVPSVALSLQLLEVLFTTLVWHFKIQDWTGTANKSNADTCEEEAGHPQGVQTSQDSGSNVDAEKADLKEAYASTTQAHGIELPKLYSLVQEVCAGLIARDSDPLLRFHSYSCYLTLLQLAEAASDHTSMELSHDPSDKIERAWWGNFEVHIPEDHMGALFEYLREQYALASEVDREGITFDVDGLRVEATSSVSPKPVSFKKDDTVTSSRYIINRCIQSNLDESDPITLLPPEELLLTVVASQAIADHALDKVYAGPLALLLLTQCDRGRPKCLRNVALVLVRRLRDLARDSEDNARHFYDVQLEAITAVYLCSGMEAAHSLSSSFMRQWGPRVMPWLERPYYRALRDAVTACVTSTRQRLNLLEVLSHWLRTDFLQEVFLRDIASQLRRACSSEGVDSDKEPQVDKFLKRAKMACMLPPPAPRPGAPTPAGCSKDRAGVQAAAGTTGAMPAQAGGELPTTPLRVPLSVKSPYKFVAASNRSGGLFDVSTNASGKTMGPEIEGAGEVNVADAANAEECCHDTDVEPDSPEITEVASSQSSANTQRPHTSPSAGSQKRRGTGEISGVSPRASPSGRVTRSVSGRSPRVGTSPSPSVRRRDADAVDEKTNKRLRKSESAASDAPSLATQSSPSVRITRSARRQSTLSNRQ